MTYKLEDAIVEAKKFNHKKDLIRESHWAYNKIRKSGAGVFDAACAHMEPLGNKYYRCIYSITLDKEIYIGLTGNPNQRLNGHRNKGTPDVKRILEAGARMEILSEFIPAKDASLLEKSLIQKFKADGYTLLNKYNDGGLGSNERIWNQDAIRAVAKNCDSVKTFRSSYPGAYKVAKNTGIFDEITSHMIRIHKMYTEDSKEDIYKAAATCVTLSEFRSKYSKFYYHSVRCGIFKKIKAALETERIYWSDEELLAESLKYKNKKEFLAGCPKAYVTLADRCRKNNQKFCQHMRPEDRPQVKISPETRAKIATANTARNLARVGIPLSEAHKLNISLSNKGRKMSENQKQQLSGIRKTRQLLLDQIDPPSIKNLKERNYRHARRISKRDTIQTSG